MIDLFAGCGGLTQGFVDKGFKPVAAVEFDTAAAATYAANFGADHTHCIDIADWRHDIPHADIIVGGPPCQGFSNLGSRNPDDPRNRLWREYVRVIQAVAPAAFIIENVDRFRRSPEFQLLTEEVDSGALQDYQIVHAVLNAADYGVPQRRRRTIVIGSRVGPPRLPEPTHAEPGTLGLLPDWSTVRDAIEDVPRQPGQFHLPDRKVDFQGVFVPGVFAENELHLRRNPTELSLLRYDCVPPGGGRFDLPDELLPNCWRNKPTGTTDVMGRMSWDRPSLTIRTEFFKPEKGQYLHPEWTAQNPDTRVNRPITHLEAARLQTFPTNFVWCGSKIEIAKQIGNAVPPVLAQAVARSVMELL